MLKVYDLVVVKDSKTKMSKFQYNGKTYRLAISNDMEEYDVTDYTYTISATQIIELNKYTGSGSTIVVP